MDTDCILNDIIETFFFSVVMIELCLFRRCRLEWYLGIEIIPETNYQMLLGGKKTQVYRWSQILKQRERESKCSELLNLGERYSDVYCTILLPLL